ncbi:hypothetical protein VPH35_062601 [Triticum aestivum]
MAAKGSKKDIETVLMQAMLAAKTVRAQRDRLLQLQQRMQDLQADAAPADVEADADAKLRELASNLFKVYYIGLEAGARILTTCIHLAEEKRILFSPPNLAFAAQAIDRVMAAVLAIKLLEEHLLPRCVECLIGGKAPVPGKTPDSSPDSSPDRDDDPVAAASEALAKVDLSDDPYATAKPGPSKPRQAARGGGGGDDRGAGLAVKHIDVAVAVLSRFMDPKELASLAEFCDDHAYISEEGFYLASD